MVRISETTSKSASSMPPLAADRFDEMLVKLFTVWLRRFDTAPSSERCVITDLMAASMYSIKSHDLAAVSNLDKLDPGGV